MSIKVKKYKKSYYKERKNMKTLMKLKEYLKRTIAMTVAASLVMF